MHPKALTPSGPPLQALARPPRSLRGPCARRTRVCARPSRGSLQTQLFQSPGTAGSEATRATPRGGGGRKRPAGGGGSWAYSLACSRRPPPHTPYSDRPRDVEPSLESALAHTKISRGAAGSRLPPHPAGRTHPPSGPLTGKWNVPIWTAFAAHNCAESPSTAHQVSLVKQRDHLQ